MKMKACVGCVVMTLLVMSQQVVAAENGWKFKLAPYLWLAGIDGDVSTIPGAATAPIKISSSDVISDTELSVMAIFTAKKQRHGILVDFLYSDVKSTEMLVPEINLFIKSTSKNTIVSTAYTYEVYGEKRAVVDLFGGARYWNVDTELELSGGQGILAGKRIRNKEDWLDPLLGITASIPLGQSQFYFQCSLAGGGFGVGSDFFYDVMATIGYHWNKSISTALGYRLLDVDYEDGTFVYDLQQDGLLLGLTWRF